MNYHRHPAILLLPLALFLSSCGEDENELTRSSLFTGLWRMETPEPLVEVVLIELDQDGNNLEGNLYIEQLGDLSEAIPLIDGSVSGGTASFDIDVTDLPEDDALNFIITLDTLRCSMVIAIAPGADTTALPEERAVSTPVENWFPSASSGEISYRSKGLDAEPIKIDDEDPGCPLDTIWIGLEETVFEDVQFHATGGTPPYIWEAVGLPFGLFIDSQTGVLSGQPSEIAGTYVFFVAAISVVQVETIHMDATIENPNLIRARLKRCAPGLCVTDRLPAERRPAGF